MPDIPDDALATIHAIAEAHREIPGGLLPALHAVQAALGHVPQAAVPILAQALNRSRAEVHGVITYYHHFRTTPPGRTVVQICGAEACLACGAQALMDQAAQRLACAPGTTRADGAVTLEFVYCLGLCAVSPAVQVDQALHARVTPEQLEGLIAAVEPPR